MSLIKNSTYNLVGFAIPTILAIPALGIIARQLGAENFGLFTLAFALVGYASIFDAGITRAVIREIAIFRDDESEKQRIIATATVVIIILGIVAGMLLVVFSNNIVKLLNVSENNYQQVILGLKLLSLVIPVYLMNQVWLAYLEGEEKFLNINIQRVISSSLLAVLPALCCLIKPTLFYSIIGITIARFCSLIITFIISRKLLLKIRPRIHRESLRRLVTFGGWLTISNIISPVMVYFDRFVISNIMGASKIAFYTAPAEGVSRLINIPYALARALFPKLSNCQNLHEKHKLERNSYLIISIVCLPIAVFGATFANTIMTLWMGPDYHGLAGQIMQILLIGFYFNSLAQIPYSLLQAEGKSKTTAFVHMAEVIPYLFALFFFTHHFGLIGTAFVWSLRTTLDFIILFILSRKRA